MMIGNEGKKDKKIQTEKEKRKERKTGPGLLIAISLT